LLWALPSEVPFFMGKNYQVTEGKGVIE
jgi:hypothetical protein